MRNLVATLLAVTIIAVAGCAPESTSTTGPSALFTLPPAVGPTLTPLTPAPSAAVSPPVSAAPSPSPGPVVSSVIAPGSAIKVKVAELNLRTNPSTSAKRIEILKKGQILIVSPYDNVWFGAGPVKKNGYTWYPVMKLQNGDVNGNLPALPTRPILIGTEVEVGWIATDNGVTSYVGQVAPRCPTTVNLANVAGMLSSERLACFGGPVVLEGTFGCPACGAEMLGVFEPVWLNYPQALSFLSASSTDLGPIILRLPPSLPSEPANGAIIRATLHVDDPAASGCSIKIEGEAAVPAATAILYCREQLVLDSFDVLGQDPDYSP